MEIGDVLPSLMTYWARNPKLKFTTVGCKKHHPLRYEMTIYIFSFTFGQDSEKYVERLLELFNKFSALVRDAFNDDPRFLTSRDKVRGRTFHIMKYTD